jgi:glucose-1-phosphate thymidylyltransferase
MSNTLGIILAAGKSTRLYPATLATTKQLLPIYDKPLIYYPLSTLMLAGIKDYIIIVSPEEIQTFQKLFSNAKNELGINITFLVQEKPSGIADAFNIVHKHLGEKVYQYDKHVLILGDNIFYGAGFSGILRQSLEKDTKATVFVYKAKDPENFGVVELDGNVVVSIQEKPKNPTSNLVATGLYVYSPSVYLYTSLISPSERGELEITDLNKLYLSRKELSCEKLPRGTVWFDTGNPDSMLEAAVFIQNVQNHQDYIIGSPHEVSIENDWSERKSMEIFIMKCIKTNYGNYLQRILEQK